MDQAQGVAQRRQLLGAIEMCARRRFADQAGLAQLATEALLDLFQLFAQDLLQLRLARHLLALGEADQHRQRRLQGVTEVAQGVARTLQGLLGVRQQVVDLLHQRLQFLGSLVVQLATLALLQLGDLQAHLLQRTQRTTHGQALQQQYQEQRQGAGAQTHPLHTGEAFQDRRIVLRHHDPQLLAHALVVAAEHQQSLLLGPIDQALHQPFLVRHFQLAVPQGA